MKRFFSAVVLPAAVLITAAATSAATAADGHSLMGIIAERRYPDSHLNRVQTADGKTINARGNRTVSSMVCQAVMTTDASVVKVVEY
ncbi:MAG: hypothetical protein GY758_27855 [Fuerstiella sp.]|nr:hypothetical protein [Fuerstiella sp.]MCP4507006.1 hypothetical protein [Fuerstiella sp.]